MRAGAHREVTVHQASDLYFDSISRADVDTWSLRECASSGTLPARPPSAAWVREVAVVAGLRAGWPAETAIQALPRHAGQGLCLVPGSPLDGSGNPMIIFTLRRRPGARGRPVRRRTGARLSSGCRMDEAAVEDE